MDVDLARLDSGKNAEAFSTCKQKPTGQGVPRRDWHEDGLYSKGGLLRRRRVPPQEAYIDCRDPGLSIPESSEQAGLCVAGLGIQGGGSYIRSHDGTGAVRSVVSRSGRVAVLACSGKDTAHGPPQAESKRVLCGHSPGG